MKNRKGEQKPAARAAWYSPSNSRTRAVKVAKLEALLVVERERAKTDARSARLIPLLEKAKVEASTSDTQDVAEFKKAMKKYHENWEKRDEEYKAEAEKLLVEYEHALDALAGAVATEADRMRSRKPSIVYPVGSEIGAIFKGPHEYLRPDRILALAADLEKIRERLRVAYADGMKQCAECGKDLPSPRGKRLFCTSDCSNAYRQRRFRQKGATRKTLRGQ